VRWFDQDDPVEFRLFLPQMRFSFDDLVDRAVQAETSGFTGVALIDHLAPPLAEHQPMYEAMTAATWLAARTERLGIGHLVLCDALRHPAVLAKEAVTLDHATGGRFELGIGSGSVPAELRSFGVFDGPMSERLDRLSETLAVLRALWSGEVVEFSGDYHHLHGIQQMPTPLGRIPIVIGGVGARTMRLVAEYADWWNLPLTAIDRLDSLRDSSGSARVSVQQMVALVTDETRRAEVADAARRRFARFGEGLVIGSVAELVEHFGTLAWRGIDRVYAWFADFAPATTLAEFGHGVIAQLA
jgi:alkanesulfonate monooxygenase SsuD/methylene tetrahydromethanopterin reductase-like flavin-dependent oxidoreductase (luciferase family)